MIDGNSTYLGSLEYTGLKAKEFHVIWLIIRTMKMIGQKPGFERNKNMQMLKTRCKGIVTNAALINVCTLKIYVEVGALMEVKLNLIPSTSCHFLSPTRSGPCEHCSVLPLALVQLH